jgi:potassium-transporting ATPase KdpC subunit
MNIVQDFFKSIRLVVVLWVLTAILYPLITLIFGQVIFPNQANGSLLKNAQGQVVGSALIGQPFTRDRYFWSRPSTVNYATQPEVATTGVSGASNLAPSNPALFDRIKPEVQRLQQVQTKPTADLLYTSGSGLDPHISLEAASAQVERVAKARGLDPNELQNLVSKHTDRPFLGIFGENGVNVLQLNLGLDQR